MQPGMEEGGGAGNNGFDDVDLASTGSLSRGPSQSHRQQGGSSLSDVINSGISAFTGNTPRRSSSNAARSGPPPPRKQSPGLLSDDGDDFAFDEDAFRVAQEEEARKRIERVKEVKRGLENFKGWRVDIVDMRVGMGGVVDV